MSISRESRRDVDSLLQRLEDEYDDFRVVEKRWEHSESRFQRALDQFEQDALGGAGVWITNIAGEVLLVRNEGDEGWADPGGKVEPGESYEAAATREVREEAGVDCSVTGLCEVHIIENVSVDRGAPSVFEAIVIFNGEYCGGEPRPREGEIAEVGWFAEPPETVLYEEVRERPYPARV
jgi:8-oxo-dGTP diphosphatase